MKLKELLTELNKIKEEHGDEMNVVLYDTEKIHHVYANKVTYSEDDGYMRPESVWIEG